MVPDCIERVRDTAYDGWVLDQRQNRACSLAGVSVSVSIRVERVG